MREKDIKKLSQMIQGTYFPLWAKIVLGFGALIPGALYIWVMLS